MYECTPFCTDLRLSGPICVYLVVLHSLCRFSCAIFEIFEMFALALVLELVLALVLVLELVRVLVLVLVLVVMLLSYVQYWGLRVTAEPAGYKVSHPRQSQNRDQNHCRCRAARRCTRCPSSPDRGCCGGYSGCLCVSFSPLLILGRWPKQAPARGQGEEKKQRLRASTCVSVACWAQTQAAELAGRSEWAAS